MRTQVRWVFVLLLVGALTVLPACPPGVPALRLIYDQGSYGDDWIGSDFDGGLISADDFVLAAGFDTVRLIQWWGTQPADETDPGRFTIRIHGDDGGEPYYCPLHSFPVVAPSREATGDVASTGDPVYEYSIEVLPIPLVAGRVYYVSIINDIGTWRWMRTAEDTGFEAFYYSDDGGVDWDNAPGNLAFRFWE